MHVYTIVHIMELLMNYMYMINDVYFVECIQLYWLWNAAYFCYLSLQSAVTRWVALYMHIFFFVQIRLFTAVVTWGWENNSDLV